MDTIVCFGDSNTFGFNPKNGSRFKEEQRWSGIIKRTLNGKFNVIEAGCNNRTCFSINPESDELTGIKIINKYLPTNANYLILALGINDLQKFYNTDENKIKNGLQEIINIAKKINTNIQIIIIAPSKIKENIFNTFFATMFNKKSVELSMTIQDIYEEVSTENGCAYINLDKIVQTSDLDGLHYEENEHKKIAETILDRYFKIFI